MKTATIIEVYRRGKFRVDITKSADSFNGLIYKDGELLGASAVGLYEGTDVLISPLEVRKQ